MSASNSKGVTGDCPKNERGSVVKFDLRCVPKEFANFIKGRYACGKRGEMMKRPSPKVITVVSIILAIFLLNTFIASGYAQTKQTYTSNWDEWFSTVKEYLSTIQSLQQTRGKITGITIDVIQKNDKAAFWEHLPKLKQKYAQIINYLKNLTPPKGLNNYHKETIKIYEYDDKMWDSMAKEDLNSMNSYKVKSQVAQLEGLEDLKRLYLQHDAPEEYIAVVDNAIVQLKQLINK